MQYSFNVEGVRPSQCVNWGSGYAQVARESDVPTLNCKVSNQYNHSNNENTAIDL